MRDRFINGIVLTRIVLDCSSVEDAIKSMGKLFGLSPDDLRKTVGRWEIDRLCNLPSPTAIRWFHATRAPVGFTFEEGLLPTSEALPKLWESLGAVAAKWTSPAKWKEYRRSFECSDRFFPQQFRRKQIAPEWEGPFAFLVRDAALRRYDVHKDFTKICETLEDICADYEDVFAHPLRGAYEAATRPCLVTFTQPGDWPGAVRAALHYVRRAIDGIEQDLKSNTNFNGKGAAVPRSSIDFVEWL
jgi:hypothetical protein